MKNLKHLLGRGLLALLLTLLLGTGATQAQINAYVANQGTQSVNVLDTATNTVTATIPVGSPRAVTVSPDGQFLYATNGNGISKIDMATNTVVGSVGTGNLVIGVAVTSDGAKAYVANNGTGTVSVVDTATMTVTATLPIAPQAIATAPDGTSIWVVSNSPVSPFPAEMAVIDSATDTFTTFPLGHGSAAPNSIAFTPDGAFAYLANFGGNFVAVIDVATQTEVATITAGNRPFYAAVSPDGTSVYVANLLSNNVSVVDTATNTVVATIPVGAFPRALAFTPDGAFVYVTNYNSGTVSVIDTATATVAATVPGFSSPWGIALPGPVPPPDCSGAVASPNSLWPPNHKYVPVQISGVANPGGGALAISITSIFQDEPTEGLADGNTCPDGNGIGTATANVRAERSALGNGRVYTISFTATGAGGSCQGSVTVCVPHTNNGSCGNGGALFNSGTCNASLKSSKALTEDDHKLLEGLLCFSHLPTKDCDLLCDAGALLCL